MATALIGHTGFVGSNLDTQYKFDEKFNSRNIGEMAGRHFGLVVCAGIQAKKWWANDHAEEDLVGIETLLNVLATVTADRFVLISTVDVYPTPIDVDETLTPDQSRNHAYGRNRYHAEQFVRERFPTALIVRLPGLFGPGLKKNVIFDLMTGNNLEKINPEGRYQYYDLRDLWSDLQKAELAGLHLVNFATEPVTTREIASALFPDAAIGATAGPAGLYDFHTAHASVWGRDGAYMVGHDAVMAKLADFVTKAKI